jgi:CHU_C Type IX secretion signal domain/Ig-like domain CHU_C associated/FG-GAP-like repeat/Putative Ig domain/IPT/TIG domain/Bacterial TSP3 repeat
MNTMKNTVFIATVKLILIFTFLLAPQKGTSQTVTVANSTAGALTTYTFEYTTTQPCNGNILIAAFPDFVGFLTVPNSPIPVADYDFYINNQPVNKATLSMTSAWNNWTGIQIQYAGVTVPAGSNIKFVFRNLIQNATTPGTHSIMFKTADFRGGAIDQYYANVIITSATPSITATSPTRGETGTTVTLTGTNFIGATAVKFNGVNAASYTVNSATSITAVVPSNATTGAITVETPNGVATGSSFTFDDSNYIINPNTDGGFEGTHGWTVVNTSNVNKWVIGEAGKVSGNNGAFVSDNGTTNTITNPQATNSKIYIYKDVVVPSNASSISLSFKYKNAANNAPKPRCLFALASGFPQLPTDGNQVIVGAEFATYLSNATTWTNYINNAPLSSDRLLTYSAEDLIPGETYRMVFEWSAANQTTYTQTSPITKYPTGGSIQTTAQGYTPGGYMDYTFTSNNDGNNYGLEWSVDNGAQIVSGQGTPTMRYFVPLGTTGTIYTSLRYTYPTPTFASNGTNSGPLAIDEVAMTFSAIPKITSIAPLSGAVGSSVTLTGEFFGASTANNVVYLGGVKCAITAATANSITLTIPANASLNNFTVLNTTSNLSCSSRDKFVPVNTALSGLSYNSNTLTSFESPVTFTTGIFATSPDQKFTITDVDLDGKADIFSYSSAGIPQVLRNTATAGVINSSTFAANVAISGVIPASPTSRNVLSADLNNDGKIDFANSNDVTNNGGFANINTSTSGTPSLQNYNSLLSSASKYKVNSAFLPIDINLDGRTDIFGLNGTNSSQALIYYTKNTTTGTTFSSLSGNAINTDSYNQKLNSTNYFSGVSGDLNDDGRPDVVLSGTGRVSVLKNTTTQGNPEVKTFSFTESVTKGINAGIGYTVKLADLDLDGKLDVITTNSTSGYISVFRNDSANMNMSIMDAQHFALTGLTATYGLALADMNGDGKPDVVVSDNNSKIAYLENTSVSGTISFAPSVSLVSSGAYTQIEITDIDGDGKPDIVAANGTNGIVLFRNRIAEAGKISADQTICYNTTPASLTSLTPATFSTAGTITYKWQKSASPTTGWTDIALTNTVGYTIPSALIATTYYRRAAALSTAPTVFYYTNPITITITPSPFITTNAPATACGTSTVTLGATSSGGVVKWFSGATGGTVLGTGDTFTTPTIATSTYYYAQAETANGCIATSARTAIQATIITTPPTIVTYAGSRCDTGSVTVSAGYTGGTGFGATINWYTAATGGSPIGTGTVFVTPSIATTTTFYADATNCNGTSATRIPVIATVVTTPSILTTVSNIGCKYTNVVLSATSTAGSSLKWYADISGTLSTATVSSITANTTRYVSAYLTASGATCESPKTAVTATMNDLPVAPTAIHTTLCGVGNTATVSVTPPANTAVNWFSSSSGGTSLGAGNSYTTPVLTSASSSSYYAAVTDVNGCVSSPRTQVNIVYNGPTVTEIASVNAITNSAVTFSATIANQTSFNWQRSTDNGLNWADITASIDPNVTYSGFSGTTATTTTLTINNAVPFIHKYQYRLKLTKSVGCVNYSNAAILNVADVFGSCASGTAATPTAFGVNTNVISSWKNFESVSGYDYTDYFYDPNNNYEYTPRWQGSISYLGYNSYYGSLANTGALPSLSDRSTDYYGNPTTYRDSDSGSTTGLIVNTDWSGQSYITLDLGSNKLINRVDLAGLSTWNPYAGDDVDPNRATPILDNDANDFVLVEKTGAYENSYDAEGGSIQVSTNGTTWTTVVPNISGTQWIAGSGDWWNYVPGSEGYGSFNFTAVNARYVRVQNNRPLGLSEFKIFPVDLANAPYIRKAPQTINYVSQGGTFNLSVPVTTSTGCTNYEWSYSADNITFNTFDYSPDLYITDFNIYNPQIGFYRLTATDCSNCSLSVNFEIRLATSYYTSAAGANAMQTLSSWKTGTNGTTGTAPINFTTAANVFVLANSASTYSSGASYSNSGSLRLNGNIATLGNYNATWGAVLESSPTAYVKTNGTGALTISTSTVPTLFPVGNSTYNPVTLTNNTGTTDTYSVSVSDAVLTSGTTGTAMNNVVNRTWKISKTGANTAGYGTDLTFEWDPSDIRGLVEDPILYAFISGNWVAQSVGSITRNGNSVTFNKYTGPLSGTLFMLSNAVPVINSFTPVSSGNNGSVVITGKALSNATVVSFGGVAATSFVVNSPTQITATVATGASGIVSVTTPAGTATLAGFTFVPAPTITSFTPTKTNRATTVTITGTNFNNATSVSLGGTPTTSFTVVNSTTITAVVGSGTTGTISVITPGGTATATGFVYGNTTPLNPTIGSIANISKVTTDPAFALPLPSSNSNGIITYTSSDSSIVSINGTMAVINGIGVATITATQAATSDYNTGSITFTVTVKTTPSIYLPNYSATVGDGTITLNAVSNSPGAITYTSGSTGVATISGNVLSVVGAGTSVITINQAASGNYTAATNTAFITVGAANSIYPTLSNFANISKMMSNPDFSLNAPTSNSAGGFTYYSSNPAVATISGSTVTLVAPGISIITAVQAANGIYRSSSISAVLTVGLGSNTNPVITNFNPLSKYLTDSPFAISSPTSTSTSLFTYFSSMPSIGSINGSTTTVKGLGIATITAIQPALGSYNAGSISTTLTVTNAPPVISYTNPNVFTKGVTISNLSPVLTGGTVNSYSINPSLPYGGLTFNTTTGVISGIPIEISAPITYTVTATNLTGSTTATFTIEVKDAVPSALSYSTPNVYAVGTSISSLFPTNSGGIITNYTISPSLPGGLVLNPVTGVISGTPSIALATTTFTITGTNSGGSTSTTISIRVTDAAPTNLEYSTPIVLFKGVLFSPITPSNSGGTIVSYAISPALPAGLTFNTSTGTITGRPTVPSASTNYTITGTNSGGTVSKIISILVNDNEPTDLSYTTPNIFRVGVTITPLTPTVYGGVVTRYSIDRPLPIGLNFDTTTGVISGTPTQITASATYIVTAFNFMGRSSAAIEITIGGPATNLSYGGNLVLARNAIMTTVTPTINSTTSTTYSVSPSLPAGLVFDTATGQIFGMPTTIQAAQSYTVTANNGFAPNATVTFTIEVVDVPVISYVTPSNYTAGVAIPNLIPTVSGLAPITFSVSPSLPIGLILNATTGEITGTPTSYTPTASYIITATNAVGSTPVTLLLTVNKRIPSISTLSINTKTFGDASFNIINPTTNSTGSFSYVSNNTSVATISGNTVTIVGAGTAIITATITADADYDVASTTATLTVNKAIPTIGTLGSISKTFGDANFNLISPTSNATGVFSYTSSDSNVVTITGNTVTVVGAGTATITATQATDANYLAGSITTTITVNKAVATLSAMTSVTKNFGDASFSLVTPTSVASGAVTFSSSDSNVAIINGNTVTVVGAGTATITATQATDANYLEATTSFVLTVNKIAPTLGAMTAISKLFGDSNFTITPPSTNSSGAFTYISSNTNVATISGSTVTIVGAGTATISVAQSTDSNYLAANTSVALTVSKAPLVLGAMAVITKNFGNPNFTITPPQTNSTGNFTYTCNNPSVATISGNIVTIVGIGTATITATQAADSNYLSGSTTVSLVVNKALPTLSSIPAITKTYGDANFTISAPTSNSTGLITLSSSNTNVATISGTTITIIGSGTATITASQAGDTNYDPGVTTTTLTVNKAMPTLSIMPALTKTYGDTAFSLVAPTSASTGLVTFVSSNLNVATISGTTVTIIGAGIATITAIQAADANYLSANTTAILAVNKLTPTLSNFNAIAKTTDDMPFTLTPPLSSGGTGAITYSSSNPAVAIISGNVVTITGSGATIITATKVSDTNYNAQTISAQLIVGVGTTQAPLLISPVSNTTGATALQINYTLPEVPLAGSVRLLFTPSAGGTPIVWTMNNATSASFAYPVSSNPTLLSNVVSGGALSFTTYNIILSYQDVFGSPVSSVTNTNIQTLAPPSISLSQNNYSGIINVALTPISVANSGGLIGSFTINPALPSGLVINPITGVITGRPTVVMTATNYTITATNPAGTATISFTLFIDGDIDGDGIGDQTDLDIDGDGVPNAQEILDGTNPNVPGAKDTDGDGVPDYVELQQGTNPNVPGAKDTDGDGVPDYIELQQGTNPNLAGDGLDSDGDGLSDYNEGYVFPNPTSSTDTDNNGTPDYLEFNNHVVSEDDLEIFNSMTTNGDALNDVFVIRGIENYPDNTLIIYNRWGVEVYNVEGYGQDDKYFRGLSEGRQTISQSAELPKGTYFYILRYVNREGVEKQRSGYLYITK